MNPFFKFVRFLVFLFCMIIACRTASAQADLIIQNANIVTMDEGASRAEALAVKNGTFLIVSDNESVLRHRGDHTMVIDAEGKTVIPGIIDAHMHPDPTYAFESPFHMVDLSPNVAETIEDLQKILSRKAELTPKGEWIRGNLYQDTKLGRHPDRYDLDAISKDHPILLTHSSYHVFVSNSYALDKAGIDHQTADPPGGAFDRDKNGKPNGILREPPALNIVLDANIPFPEPDGEEEIQAYWNTFNRFIEKGITSVADAALESGKFPIYIELVDRGMPVRIYQMFRPDKIEHLSRLGIKTGFGDERLKIGSIKVFHGNSLSGQTCWLYEPYKGRPDYYGIPPDRSQKELNELVLTIHKADLQAAIHANGDREIDMVLTAIENALLIHPKKDHRHRIEHASVANERILRKAKELDVILAFHSYIYEHGDKMVGYGEHRWPWMHANGTALEYGIVVAGNSDYPVSAADPMLRIQSLVTRSSAEGNIYGGEQAITPDQALWTFTMGGAIAQFEEEIKGSISKGKLADFVVLSDDLNSVDPFEIKDIKVLHTFINGNEVFRKHPDN